MLREVFFHVRQAVICTQSQLDDIIEFFELLVPQVQAIDHPYRPVKPNTNEPAVERVIKSNAMRPPALSSAFRSTAVKIAGGPEREN